jgi:hypothetical protein
MYTIIPDPLYAIGKYEDDLVLEVVVLLGTAAADEGCAMLLCKADILLSLIELLKGKQDSPSQSADAACHIWHIAYVWSVGDKYGPTFYLSFLTLYHLEVRHFKSLSTTGLVVGILLIG